MSDQPTTSAPAAAAAATAGPGNELRRDPLTGDWVGIVGARQERPNLPAGTTAAGGCPFCVGGLEAPGPYGVRAFENRWPALRADAAASWAPGGAGQAGQESAPATGACEVVLYSPDHDATLASIGPGGVRRVIDLWADRTQALLAREDIGYVLVFETRGPEIGATIAHPHGQLYAFPEPPPYPAREFAHATAHGCALCLHTPAGARLVSRAGNWSAEVPYAPSFPYSVLLAHADHVAHLHDLDDDDRDDLATLLADVLGRFERLFDTGPMPYMLFVHPGEHLHVHVESPMRAPGTLRHIAAGETGSGMAFNPVVPEQAASALRHA